VLKIFAGFSTHKEMLCISCAQEIYFVNFLGNQKFASANFSVHAQKSLAYSELKHKSVKPLAISDMSKIQKIFEHAQKSQLYGYTFAISDMSKTTHQRWCINDEIVYCTRKG